MIEWIIDVLAIPCRGMHAYGCFSNTSPTYCRVKISAALYTLRIFHPLTAAAVIAKRRKVFFYFFFIDYFSYHAFLSQKNNRLIEKRSRLLPMFFSRCSLMFVLAMTGPGLAGLHVHRSVDFQTPFRFFFAFFAAAWPELLEIGVANFIRGRQQIFWHFFTNTKKRQTKAVALIDFKFGFSSFFAERTALHRKMILSYSLLIAPYFQGHRIWWRSDFKTTKLSKDSIISSMRPAIFSQSHKQQICKFWVKIVVSRKAKFKNFLRFIK